ncbi:MAG: CDP-diacylglycerol--glycerol-3-phosphate 3-phosphatidyltransferase [Bacilli bacterium]|nr:CDP-diacylglycerol--glycerol-3-phosphate 3-phosphatidyltransferase [Bacilli bacterium]
MKMNLPNKITMFRLFLSIVLVIILLFPFYAINVNFKTFVVNDLIIIDTKYIIAGIIFIVASLTDFLDGHIARKNNLVTDFGKFTDAIADKILVNSVLIIFAAQGLINPLIPVIVISRDTIVDAIRMLAASKNKVIAAGKMGKVKTATLMIALTLTFFYNLPFELWNIGINDVLLIIATALSVYSGFEYYYNNKKVLFEK